MVNSHLEWAIEQELKLGKKSVKSVSCQEFTLILRKKKGEEGHDIRRITGGGAKMAQK